MHGVGSGEGVQEVGEDVERCERDELVSTPKDPAEEEAGVVLVGEVDEEAGDLFTKRPGAHAVEFLDPKHVMRVGREVVVPGAKEASSELSRRPPRRDSPHGEPVPHHHTQRPRPLGHGAREDETWAGVELHGGGDGGLSGGDGERWWRLERVCLNSGIGDV